MDLALSSEQMELRDAILDFARKELSGSVTERDRAHTFSRELWDKCGRMGLTGLPVSEQYGGLGLDAVSCTVALEALGYACSDGGLNFSVCAHLLACVIPVWKHGDEGMKQRFLPDLCSGRLIAVNAMTEPSTGSDAFAMTTRATVDGAGFRLNGRKIFCSNGPVADVALVYALTDEKKAYYGGVTAFLVPTDTEGFSVGQVFEKMGLRTSPISELVLEDVYVPQNCVVGKVGGGSAIFTQSMDWERTCLGALHVGTMQKLLEDVVDYARTRQQFGQPIGKNQAVSHKIADMKVRLEAARLLTYQASSRLESSREAGLDAAIAKLFVSEAFVQTARDCVQVMGGYGFMVESEIERVMRDALGSTIYSGTSEMQRNIIGRWLGL